MSSPDTLKIVAVPSDRAHEFWPLAMPHLERASRTNDGLFSPENIEASIKTGEYILWVVLDGKDVIAAATTRVIQYPRRKALAIDWLGGSRMKEWIDDINAAFFKHAEFNGCSHVECCGPRAWGRVLGKFGWNQVYVTYRREI